MLCWQRVLLFTVVMWCFFRSPAMVAVDPVPWSPLMSVSQCNFQGISLDVVSTWGFLVILILIYCNLWYWVLHSKTQYQLDVSMRKSWNLFHGVELFNALCDSQNLHTMCLKHMSAIAGHSCFWDWSHCLTCETKVLSAEWQHKLSILSLDGSTTHWLCAVVTLCLLK